MILYNPIMANTKSAKKNIRSSARKKAHNDRWEMKYKSARKSLSKAISAKEKDSLKEKFVLLQKYLDKAAKEKTIHKNKANRVKSIYARKIAALNLQEEGGEKPTASKRTSGRKTK